VNETVARKAQTCDHKVWFFGSLLLLRKAVMRIFGYAMLQQVCPTFTNFHVD